MNWICDNIPSSLKLRQAGRVQSISILLAAGLICGTSTGQTQDIETESNAPVVEETHPESSDWDFIIAFPMLWAPSIKGKVESDGDDLDITVPFGDIFDSLAFGFIGEFYARKGRWSGALKVNYLSTKSESDTDGLNGPIWGVPIAPSHRIEARLSMSANDLQIQYDVNRSFAVYTGIRHFFTRVNMDITPLGSGILEIEEHIPIADDHLFDWVVGVTLRQKLSERWAIGLNADTMVVGQNDVDFLVNGLVFLRINDLNNVWFGYRYLQIGTNGDDLAGTFDTRFTQQGPTAGWAFTF